MGSGRMSQTRFQRVFGFSLVFQCQALFRSPASLGGTGAWGCPGYGDEGRPGYGDEGRPGYGDEGRPGYGEG